MNWLKAVLTPHQHTKFLGMVVDVLAMRFYMPGHKVEKIEEMFRNGVNGPEGPLQLALYEDASAHRSHVEGSAPLESDGSSEEPC